VLMLRYSLHDFYTIPPHLLSVKHTHIWFHQPPSQHINEISYQRFFHSHCRLHTTMWYYRHTHTYTEEFIETPVCKLSFAVRMPIPKELPGDLILKTFRRVDTYF
jgi:hypothetical protein